jgi:uncharacterized protein
MGVAGGDKWGQMAQDNTVLRATTGSQMYGISISDSSDSDELAVCVESIGAFAGFTEFEQFVFRTAAARTGQHDAPSEAGDLDLTIYGLKKFLRLALGGNPSVMDLLFVPAPLILHPIGEQIQALAPWIVSRQAGRRYLGYMESQRQRMLGERGQKRVNRTDLEAAHGFDTKYMSHILRLGYQGVELLETGRLTLPLPQSERDFIKAVRRGEWSLNTCLTEAGDLEHEIKGLIDTSPLPDEPDRDYVEKWMLRVYSDWWQQDASDPS